MVPLFFNALRSLVECFPLDSFPIKLHNRHWNVHVLYSFASGLCELVTVIIVHISSYILSAHRCGEQSILSPLWKLPDYCFQ